MQFLAVVNSLLTYLLIGAQIFSFKTLFIE